MYIDQPLCLLILKAVNIYPLAWCTSLENAHILSVLPFAHINNYLSLPGWQNDPSNESKGCLYLVALNGTYSVCIYDCLTFNLVLHHENSSYRLILNTLLFVNLKCGQYILKVISHIQNHSRISRVCQQFYGFIWHCPKLNRWHAASWWVGGANVWPQKRNTYTLPCSWICAVTRV